ncbi:AAA family ATPase [Kineosporia sp. J2-2]|uniref:AAA family ATPase n=1 Tax=Kineosporia corallincola TaxID=2835133 RepID=A0ABS5TGH7_9ACTN|nr:LuxR family transcriptional regulator [Kineosporia corallincola]MBT0770194.1 AAA family ATPase [Kineosporia corallincola]
MADTCESDRLTASGREPERRAVRHLVRRLREGSGGVLLIEGEAGAGRSTLMEHALAEAARVAGVTVLSAAADEFSPRFPLQVLQDALTDADLTTVEQVLAHLSHLTDEQPVLLAVDDLHWADETTLLAWHRLARLARHRPLLLTGTHRPTPPAPPGVHRDDLPMLRRALIRAGAEVITLGPLPGDTVTATVDAVLARRAHRGLPDIGTHLHALAARTAGNPRYLADLVQAAEHQDTPDGLPDGLATVIEARLDFLSLPARAVLGTAALLGDTFSADDLAVAGGHPVSTLVSVLEELSATGLLAESHTHLTFRHPLLRDALYQRIPAGVRRMLHRQAGTDLADAGTGAHIVLKHLVAAHDPTRTLDERTADWLVQTGEPLVAHDPDGTAELLTAALTAVGENDPRTGPLRVLLAQARWRQGRSGEAAALASQVISAADDPGTLAAMTWISAWTTSNTDDDSTTEPVAGTATCSLLRRTLAAPGLPPVTAVRLRAALAHRLLGAGDQESAASAAATILRGESADPLARAIALGVNAVVMRPHRQRQDTDLRQALDLASGHDDPAAAQIRLWLAERRVDLLSTHGPAQEARTAARDLLAQAQRYGSSPALARARVLNADLLYDHGDWDEALELLAATPSPAPDDRHRRQGLLALIALHRGDTETAAEAISGVVNGSDERLTLARALLAEQRGHPEEALAVLTVTHPVPAAQHQVLTRLRLATSARDDVPTDILSGLHQQTVDDETPLRTAQYVENLALVRARTGDLPGARTAHSRAGALYLTLGAQGELQRLDALLRPHGVQRRRAAKRPVTGWAALTPAEVSIAQLVAEGRTNADIAAQLFVSRRTVEGHVSHILAKLGLRSRVELARDAGRRSRAAALAG